MNLEIRQGIPEDYENVRAFYHSLTDAMKDAPYKPGWEKDIYPDPQMLKSSLAKGQLYIGYLGENIACAMIVNHDCNEGYNEYDWKTKASGDEVTLIHALGVHPDYAGHGLGRQLVAYVIEMAKANHQKAIRLDVLTGNVPAEKLYTYMGFECLHTLKMFYEDTGWTDYSLYEYVL